MRPPGSGRAFHRLPALLPLIHRPTPAPWRPHTTDYFWRWTNYLPWFGGADKKQVFNSASAFQGCGGNSVWDLDYVEFVAPYNWGGDRWICIDAVQLV